MQNRNLLWNHSSSLAEGCNKDKEGPFGVSITFQFLSTMNSYEKVVLYPAILYLYHGFYSFSSANGTRNMRERVKRNKETNRSIFRKGKEGLLLL